MINPDVASTPVSGTPNPKDRNIKMGDAIEIPNKRNLKIAGIFCIVLSDCVSAVIISKANITIRNGTKTFLFCSS